jgi:RimJ/RimL family protein N-acetyltransferase
MFRHTLSVRAFIAHIPGAVSWQHNYPGFRLEVIGLAANHPGQGFTRDPIGLWIYSSVSDKGGGNAICSSTVGVGSCGLAKMAMIEGLTIRSATPADAADYNAYRRRIADEPDNNITYWPGEYTRTIEEMQRLLAAMTGTQQHILIAEVHGEIIGHCACGGSTKRALRHAVGLGIDIDRHYRNQGVGTALMQAMIDWARANPAIRRIELDVFTHNLPAINLYLKFGFEIEGRKHMAYFKEGGYVDAYLMALILDGIDGA